MIFFSNSHCDLAMLLLRKWMCIKNLYRIKKKVVKETNLVIPSISIFSFPILKLLKERALVPECPTEWPIVGS